MKKNHPFFSNADSMEWCIYHGITRRTSVKDSLLSMLQDPLSLSSTQAREAVQMVELNATITYASLQEFIRLRAFMIAGIQRK